MDNFRDAWDSLYRSQARPWRGVADISWIDVPAGSRVIDLGCGNGKTSAALLDKGAIVTGIDFSRSAVESCQNLLGDRAEFLVADVRALPFSEESFDFAVSVHCIEHVPASDVHAAAKEIMRVIRPGGRLFLRCFAENDMRSDGKKEDIRNGILYRYLSEEDIREIFSSCDILSLELIEDGTRFGTVRRRWEGIISKR